MPHPPSPRRLRDDDVLYRKVETGQWSEERGLHPEAFIDDYPEQSFFVEGRKSAHEVLAMFAAMAGMRRRFGNPRLTARHLWNEGLRVAAVTVAAVKQAGCGIKPDDRGNEYSNSGHVNVIDARIRYDKLIAASRLLSETEVFDT
jgi:hypothetical protein